MSRILLLILPLLFLFANDQAKLIYIKQENLNNNSQTYVGQTIAIKYNILVLDNSSISSVGFLDSPNSNTTLKNPNSSWNELDDGSLENIYLFKINNTEFYIPKLEVIINNGEIIEQETSDVINGNAIALNNNHPLYSGVVATRLDIGHHSIKFYSQNSNIIVFDINADHSNLEDFKLNNALEQGFERKTIEMDQSSGIYYAIIPNNIREVEFEYFNLETQSYKKISIQNTINKDQISVNQDINPINKALIFQNITIVVLILLFIGTFFIKKIPIKIRILSIIIAVILLLYLVFSFNFKKEAVIINNSYITILPTRNSTIIEQVMANTNVEIVNSHGNYYKIITNDGKTGWINKSNLK